MGKENYAYKQCYIVNMRGIGPIEFNAFVLWGISGLIVRFSNGMFFQFFDGALVSV